MTPDNFTIKEFNLEVGDGHSIYIQDWGNKKAKTPIIFLHGGPGGNCHDKHKLQFDGKIQRVIFFDQRGTGNSFPKGSLIDNNTQAIVEDIEKIAKYLKLDKFILTGGSWGSCLAFAYAIKYPKRLKAMVLKGIFTGSRDEIKHVDSGGFKDYFPDVWSKYLSQIPKKFHTNPTAYIMNEIKSGDPERIKKSCYTYALLESALLHLDDRFTDYNYDEFDPEGMKIELHYLDKLCFMPNEYILKNAHKIKTPTWLIQGRYDMVCPPITAHRMHQKMPNSKLIYVTAGHSGTERSIFDTTKSLLLEIAAN